jgi:hypothetical protein
MTKHFFALEFTVVDLPIFVNFYLENIEIILKNVNFKKGYVFCFGNVLRAVAPQHHLLKPKNSYRTFRSYRRLPLRPRGNTLLPSLPSEKK